MEKKSTTKKTLEHHSSHNLVSLSFFYLPENKREIISMVHWSCSMQMYGFVFLLLDNAWLHPFISKEIFLQMCSSVWQMRWFFFQILYSFWNWFLCNETSCWMHLNHFNIKKMNLILKFSLHWRLDTSFIIIIASEINIFWHNLRIYVDIIILSLLLYIKFNGKYTSN